jgi:hypothetical protein
VYCDAQRQDGFPRHFASPSHWPPEHQSPRYSAGYDAGFQAGLLAASQGAPPPPPPPGLVAAEGCAGTGASEPARPPLVALVEDFPDLFQKEVLERLDPLDLALLGRTGNAVRAAVVSSGRSHVGGSAEAPRVGIASFCQSLSMFIWGVANGCRWQCAATSRSLVRGGHLEVLRWAREHGCPLDGESCASAALGGHLEVLRWLREHDCRWNEWTCANAALRGHLEVLKWARERQCSWNVETCASRRFQRSP